MTGRAQREGGQVTVFVAVIIVGLLVLAGLVADGGRLFAATRAARNAASGAARAGAQALSETALRTPDAPVTLDPADATARAQEYLATAGHTGTVEVVGTTVTVTVTTEVAPQILGVVGMGARRITVTEAATNHQGP